MRPVHSRLLRQSALASLALAFVACSDTDNLTRPPVQGLYTTPTGLVTANPPQIFIGAGDISSCSNNGDEMTAEIIDTIPGTVYNLGDDAYDNGTTSEFNNCYNPTWGRFKSRTKPSAGNHEYNTSGASGYYAYFGAAAGDPSKGYYSYSLGLWHVIVLNSNISRSVGSAQDTWLKSDLDAHPGQCTVAYWHHPLYSSTGGSGSGGVSISSMKPFWDRLYAAHADLVLNGHRHFYERLKPMKPDGSYDPTNGITEIIAGSGGIGGGTETNLFPTHVTGNGDTRGVLKLYLYDDSFAWRFIPIAGKTYTDSGSTACHSSGGGGGGVSAGNSTVAAAPTSITAGGSGSTISVTAKDGSGNPISGATVVLAATGSGNTVTQPTSTTNASGVATGTLSSTIAESKTVSATINGTAITQQATVTVTPAAASALAFAAQPSNEQAGAPITPAVVVQIQDQYGNRVNSSANVAMAIGANPASGTLSGTTPQAAVNGVATFSDLAIDKIGTGYTLVASSTGLSSATSSAFNITAPAPSAALSTVVAGTPSFAAGGSSAITVTVKDGLGNPLSGVTVTLSSSVVSDVVTQPAATTDASGVASGSVTATSAGSRTITAVAGGITLTQKPSLTVTAAGPDAGASTVSASPTSITAGSGTSTITVTVRDQYGNPVSGSSVVLASSGTNVTVTQPGSATGSNGVATGSVSSTDVQPLTVSATAGGMAITQTASVTVTNQPPPGITHTLLTSGHDPTNTSTFTTAAIAPAANALVTVAVLTHQSSAAASSPTLTGGGMTGWTVVASVAYNGATPLDRLTIYRAMSSSPGSGPITITSSVTVSNCQWIVSQWSGVDQSGTNGSGAIVQTASATGSAVTSLTAALAAFASTSNVAYGAFGAASATAVISAGSGFTTIDQQPSGEGTVGDLFAERAPNLPAVTASWSSRNAGALGVEIKAAP